MEDRKHQETAQEKTVGSKEDQRHMSRDGGGGGEHVSAAELVGVSSLSSSGEFPLDATTRLVA